MDRKKEKEEEEEDGMDMEFGEEEEEDEEEEEADEDGGGEVENVLRVCEGEDGVAEPHVQVPIKLFLIICFLGMSCVLRTCSKPSTNGCF